MFPDVSGRLKRSGASNRNRYEVDSPSSSISRDLYSSFFSRQRDPGYSPTTSGSTDRLYSARDCGGDSVLVKSWSSWPEFSRIFGKAAAAVRSRVTDSHKWHRRCGRENPSKESEAGEQLAFREKPLRGQPPLFRRAGFPIPIARWFRSRL